MGKDFHFVYDDEYKSASRLLTLLLEIVCKGGNFALNVSPQPDARFPKRAQEILQELGRWLKKYGEAIYCTRPCPPYKAQNIFLTQTTTHVYAVAKGKPMCAIPCEQKISGVEFLNQNRFVAFRQTADGIALTEAVETDEEYFVFKLYKASEQG